MKKKLEKWQEKKRNKNKDKTYVQKNPRKN